VSALQLLIAVAGCGVTGLVVVAMILITPRGVVDLRAKATESHSPDVGQAEARQGAERVPPRP